MSRHRNVRSMNVSDEYDYDDVYGHSVEEDYCMSPSEAAFMYDRDGAKHQHRIGSFLSTEKDIAEEDEDGIDNLNLTHIDKARLEACIEQVLKVVRSATKQEIINAAVAHNFNAEKTTSYLQQQLQPTAAPEKIVYSQPKIVLQTQPEVDAETKFAAESKLVAESKPATESKSACSEVKVVAASGLKPTIVTKGFEVNQFNRLNTTPRSQSPASGRGTPISMQTSPDPLSDEKIIGKKDNKVDAAGQYKKERGDAKEHLYMIVIGHVDAGKSTLMGHLLCKLGQVNQKTMHKYEQESRKLGKQSFMYAWVLDETGEERNRGITMDVGRSQFETDSKLVTLLDAPGHKDFIPNMIAGAGQADVALLVVDATRGEFETGFDFGGQTREHAVLVRSLGVTQIAVAINKLDTVSWSQDRFKEITQKLRTFLKQAGFRDSDVTFVPCSGLTGQNLIEKPTENELISWYTGPCLLNVIDNFKSPERPVSKSLRFSVNDVFKGTGSGFCVSGRVETGTLNVGDKLLVCPSKEQVTVKAIAIEEMPHQVVFAGDQASITLSGIEMQNVNIGCILCDPQNPVQVSSKFQARVIVFNTTVPITRGFPVVLHHQSLVEPAVISKLITQLNKSTGEVVKKHPRFLGNNTSAMVEIQATRPIALELYSDCKELGRVMLRVGGVTIAAGLITNIT